MADDTNAVEAVSGSNVGAQMSYEDMREWLKEAERLGELRVAEGLSWEKILGKWPKSCSMMRTRQLSFLITYKVAHLGSVC